MNEQYLIRLSGDYVQGYTAALQDVLNNLGTDMTSDLKYHGKRWTISTVRNLVQCMIENRAVLRERPVDAFIRCNNDTELGFEVYFDKR